MVLKIRLMAVLNLNQMEAVIHIEQPSVSIVNVARVDDTPIVIKRDISLIEEFIIVRQQQKTIEHIKSLQIVGIPPRLGVDCRSANA